MMGYLPDHIRLLAKEVAFAKEDTGGRIAEEVGGSGGSSTVPRWRFGCL